MQLIFAPDSILFKNHTTIQRINNLPIYKRHYKSILENFILEVEIDPKYINKIIFSPKLSKYGVTSHFIQENKIYFDIELSDDLLPYLTLIPDSTQTFMAKAVFQHELFHCVERRKLYEEQIFHKHDPFNKSSTVSTTYDFLLDEAIVLWSEFYACYHNRKLNIWHEVPNGAEDITATLSWIKAVLQYAQQSNAMEFSVPEDFLKTLHTFWYNMISVIALHIHSNEDILIQDYVKDTVITQYFNKLYDYLAKKLQNYPVWLSESNYLEFGKLLMSIIELYHLTYSTDDFSDNFVFRINL